MTFLLTPRLRLRRLTPDDVDHLADLDADPAVMRHLTGRPTPRQDLQERILPRLVAQYDADGGLGIFAAEVRATGAFGGWLALRVPPGGTRDDVEIGWRLRRDHWGHGYATEGAQALLDAGFAWLGVPRVYAETMTVNAASRRVMERIGLRYVGPREVDWHGDVAGAEQGDVEYALTRQEWEAAGAVVLRTPRLLLRRLRRDDLDALVELDADPEVTRYLNGGRPTSREVAAEQLGRPGRYAAEEHGRFAGWFELTPGHELGWRLRRDAWGRGLATEGATALLETAFTLLGVERVWAQTMTVNERSRRVMTKLGLRYVRTFHANWGEEIAGSTHGDVEYALTHEEWTRASHGPGGA